MSAPPFDTFLSIGDITFRTVSDDRHLASRAGGPLELFSADHGRADVDIKARWTERLAASGGRMLFDSGGAWQLRESDGDFVFTFRSSIGGPAPYKIARFNRAFTGGDVQLDRRHFDGHLSDAAYPLQYPLDELVMIHLLSQGKGVEIHGCGVLDRAGRAYLFAGQSGAGKSTLARLWVDHGSGVSLLSDERVVLRTDRDPTAVYGTPWQGDARLASPQSGPLAAVFFLNRAATHTVTPTDGSRAAARLFSCAFLPFHSADAVDRTITAVARVVSQTPCYDLWFAPDPSVIDVLTRHME